MQNLPKRKLAIGILPSLGGSIESQKKDGREGLFLNYYLPTYQKKFSEIYYFSYANEKELNNPTLSILRNSNNVHRYMYAFLLPFIYQKEIRQCSLLRVMHANGALPAVVAKILWHVPFVCTYGYNYVNFAKIEGHPVKAVALNLVIPIFLRLADGIIVTTDDLKKEVENMIGHSLKITLVPNGTDTNWFVPAQAMKNDSVFRFLFVGRLEKQKNLPFLFEVISELRQSKNIELTIIGTGSLQKELEERTQKENLPIRFLGSISYSEIPKYHQQTDCFISTSFIEGHPKALIEAMSSGLCCIVSNCSGHLEMIKSNQNGLLLQNNNIRLWINTITDLAAHPEMRRQMAAEARKLIVKNYDIHATLTREIELLHDVISPSTNS